MSESLVFGLVAITGLLGLMVIAIVAINLGLNRGSLYGWRRQRVSVNTVQTATPPVDCVTQTQLKDLEKQLAAQRSADQANVNSRFAGVNDRLDNLASAVADLRQQLNDDALNAIVLLQRDLRSYRTSCNLRHAAQIVRNNVVSNLAAFIGGLVAWLLVAAFGWPVIGWFSAIFIAGPLAAFGVGHLSGWFASWFIDWRRDRRQATA